MEAEPDVTTSSTNTTNNKSSTQAEYGTSATGETQEDPEDSSIEALNWSDIDEEEMSVLVPEKKGVSKGTDLPSSGTTQEGPDASLSSSLLQSINSTIFEDDQAVRNSVIESWASSVKIAAERGEIELDKDFSDRNGPEQPITQKKRKSNDKTSQDMTTSTTDSKDDPLSTAPVLDDGVSEF